MLSRNPSSDPKKMRSFCRLAATLAARGDVPTHRSGTQRFLRVSPLASFNTRVIVPSKTCTHCIHADNLRDHPGAAPRRVGAWRELPSSRSAGDEATEQQRRQGIRQTQGAQTCFERRRADDKFRGDHGGWVQVAAAAAVARRGSESQVECQRLGHGPACVPPARAKSAKPKRNPIIVCAWTYNF